MIKLELFINDELVKTEFGSVNSNYILFDNIKYYQDKNVLYIVDLRSRRAL